MHWRRVAAAVLLSGSVAPAATTTDPGCVRVQAYARPAGIGYTHIATTHDGCQRAVRCELWTDVDPEPRRVIELEPGESEETYFRIGSPASTFRAFFSCEFVRR